VRSCNAGEVVTDDSGLVRTCVSCYDQGQLVSSDGASCVSLCNAGEARDGQPWGNGYGHSPARGAYGAFGYTCVNCANQGALISSDGAMCVASCNAGEAVLDDGSSPRACAACSQLGLLTGSDGVSCVSQCSAGEILSGYMCYTCASQNMLLSADGSTCVWSCGAGEAPDGQDYGNGYGYSFLFGWGYGYGHSCINCRQQGAYISSYAHFTRAGGSCTWGCNGGELVIDDGSSTRSCVACYAQGQLASSDGTSCVLQCSAGEALDGQHYGGGYGYSTLYNTNGAYGFTCINCRQHGAYVNLDGSICVRSCSAGEMVSADGSTCVAAASPPPPPSPLPSPPARALYSFPPKMLTSSSTMVTGTVGYGTYTTSSSTQYGGWNSENSYRPFDGSTPGVLAHGSSWTTNSASLYCGWDRQPCSGGQYLGGVTSAVARSVLPPPSDGSAAPAFFPATCAGEWLQLNMPLEIQLANYSLVASWGRAPRSWQLLCATAASPDWVQIDTQAGVEPWEAYNGDASLHSFTLRGATPLCSRFRLCVSRIGAPTTRYDNGWLSIKQMSLTGSLRV
jgi:hypothetical protein